MFKLNCWRGRRGNSRLMNKTKEKNEKLISVFVGHFFFFFLPFQQDKLTNTKQCPAAGYHVRPQQ